MAVDPFLPEAWVRFITSPGTRVTSAAVAHLKHAPLRIKKSWPGHKKVLNKSEGFYSNNSRICSNPSITPRGRCHTSLAILAKIIKRDVCLIPVQIRRKTALFPANGIQGKYFCSICRHQTRKIPCTIASANKSACVTLVRLESFELVEYVDGSTCRPGPNKRG